MTKRCEHCGIINPGNYHLGCPYEPSNLRRILLFLRRNLEENSRFEKNFCPFPSSEQFDEFAKNNRIMRLQTIKVRYFDDFGLEDWLSELIDIGLRQKLLTEDEFPYFVRYIFDSWCFLDKKNYAKAYEMVIAFEEGDDIFDEKRPLPDGAIQFTLNLDTES